MRQPLGDSGEHGLALSLGGLAASGTSMCSMCTPWSSLSCSEELPGKSSRVAGELRGSSLAAMAQHLPPLHTPSCPREQGGSCEGPSGDLSPRACRLHTMAQRRFYEGQIAHGAAWGAAHSRAAVSPRATRRGTLAMVHTALGKGCAAKRGMCVGNGEGGKDGDTNCATTVGMVAQTGWLQRSLLVLRQGQKKGFLGSECRIW